MVDLCLSQVNPGFDLFDFQTFKVHPVSLKIHQRVHALADIIHFRLNKVQLYIQKHAILWSHIPENFPFFNSIKGFVQKMNDGAVSRAGNSRVVCHHLPDETWGADSIFPTRDHSEDSNDENNQRQNPHPELVETLLKGNVNRFILFFHSYTSDSSSVFRLLTLATPSSSLISSISRSTRSGSLMSSR